MRMPFCFFVLFFLIWHTCYSERFGGFATGSPIVRKAISLNVCLAFWYNSLLSSTKPTMSWTDFVNNATSYKQDVDTYTYCLAEFTWVNWKERKYFLCHLNVFPSQEKAEEKYGAVTFKVFFDFNNQKLQVEGRFICTTPDTKHFFFY